MLQHDIDKPAEFLWAINEVLQEKLPGFFPEGEFHPGSKAHFDRGKIRKSSASYSRITGDTDQTRYRDCSR